MADLYEVLLVDDGSRWHAGFLVDDETETDVLLADQGRVLLFGSRAGLEHAAQERRLQLVDDLPDEVDLDLGGWLPRGTPQPPLPEVLELWQLLVDDPVAGRPLADELVEEAYDDLVEETPDWYDVHGETARRALSRAVQRLRGVLRRPV
ncbi:MAG: hypothetical protein JWN57_547 [Frankiales bacterium]|nr:hypothetical protein [Frankiales bacterium]